MRFNLFDFSIFQNGISMDIFIQHEYLDSGDNMESFLREKFISYWIASW